jgi:hypothetical protein
VSKKSIEKTGSFETGLIRFDSLITALPNIKLLNNRIIVQMLKKKG